MEKLNQMDRSLKNSAQSGILLSIITVTRNDADRLSKTIQSLFQFYGDSRYEHIIVDGRSTDHTADVVDPLLHTPNFRFDSDLDEGIYDAMNRGAQRSRGRYMLFLNCGDRILTGPDELAVLLRDIDYKYMHIMCFAFAHIDNNSFKVVLPQKAKRYKLPTSHQGMIFLSTFVLTHLYDKRYKIAADYDLYLHAQPSQIIITSAVNPLTAVELHGVASGNPLISYKEYLKIAYRNLHGIERLLCLIRIGYRAMFVIPLKLLLPQGWIARMRLRT